MELIQVGTDLLCDLASGEAVEYRVDLQGDEYFEAKIDQLGIDVTVELLDPNGSVAMEVDSPIGRQGIEWLKFVARLPGAHRLRILANERGALAGKFRLVVVAKHKANSLDRLRSEAENFLARADALRNQSTKQSLEQASNFYLSALSGFRELGDAEREAATVFRIALARRALGETAAAVELLEQALVGYRALPKSRHELGYILKNLGDSYRELGQSDRALQLYEANLEGILEHDIGVATLNSMALLLQEREEFSRAEGLYRQASALFQANWAPRQLVSTLNSLGQILSLQGKFEEAIGNYDRAIEILQKNSDFGGLGLVLGNRAHAKERLGRFYEAAIDLDRAVLMARQTGNQHRLAGQLFMLGCIRVEAGDILEGRAILEEAITLFRQLNLRNQEIAAVNYLRRLGTEDSKYPDLVIQVILSSEPKGTLLSFVVSSPSGAVELGSLAIRGPALRRSPAIFAADLARNLNAFYRQFDTEGSILSVEDIESELSGLGRSLYYELFSQEMRDFYRDIRSRVTTLQIISNEAWIPWELLKPYDDQDPSNVIDDDFLCLRYEFTRWLSESRTGPEKIYSSKIAFVGTDNALSSVSAEREVIHGLVERFPEMVDLSLKEATFKEFEALLVTEGLGVIHYAGHGSVDPGGESAIRLRDRSFRAKNLLGAPATMISRNRPLVFLNTCIFGTSSSRTAFDDWASILLNQCGCGAFIGARWSLEDKLALEFAKEFYKLIGSGETLGGAVRKARLNIREASPGNVSWISYIIFSNPYCRIVFEKATHQTQKFRFSELELENFESEEQKASIPPRGREWNSDGVERAKLAFWLVSGRHASPSLLQSLDPIQCQSAAEQAAVLQSEESGAQIQQLTSEPSPIWVAWLEQKDRAL